MSDDISWQKAKLRKQMRKVRREHAAALPAQVSALVFKRPPAAVLEMIPQGAIIGLYRAVNNEAPAFSYAKFFFEAGYKIALPRLPTPEGLMDFRLHTDPFEEDDLEIGPKGIRQPSSHAESLVPQVLFVPLLGFTEDGQRIGQGGGFYDRWLAANPGTLAIGMAWDVQLVDSIPAEEHDMKLSAIITPTRLYGPL